MNFKKFLIGAAPALLLASCASEDMPDNPDNGKTGNLYTTVKLHMATSNRSTTGDYDGNTNSSDGFEIGKDRENTISNMTVVLATKDADGIGYTPLASSTKYVATMPDPVNGNYTILFEDQEIIAAAEKDVYVFAFCNTTVDLDNALDVVTNGIASISSDNAPIWQDDNFMMLNAPNTTLTAVKMPTEKELLNNYNSAEKAFNLDTVDVARVAARLDFKNNNTPNNTYDIKDVNDDNATVAQVQFVGMAPINIAKDFYYLPRVSADGTSHNWNICGTETNNNYVVSPNFDLKASSPLGNEILGKYLHQLNSGNLSALNYTSLATFDGEDDNDDNWGNGQSAGFNKEGYKIWRYVTENTIPGKDNQKRGITTGVVFKAEIINPQLDVLKKTMEEGRAIYQYNGVFYGDVNSLRLMAAKQSTGSKFYQDFVAVFGEAAMKHEVKDSENGKIYKFEIETLPEDYQSNNTVNGKNVYKIYRPTVEGGANHYYVYYTYYNRHNDNGNNNEMGTMEFGTVRNNIYKLAINSVSRFGHTDNPDDDDDPDTPDTPDEDPKTYFKVSCRVLPWMVRINNIDF